MNRLDTEHSLALELQRSRTMATSKQEGEEQRRNRDLQRHEPAGPVKVDTHVPGGEDVESEPGTGDGGGRQQGGSRGS